MSTLRAGQPGATRLCPHCKATVLESASICPGCRHHLRFSGGRQLAEESYTALSVDGTIAHRPAAEPCEYCIVLDISNERGEQVMRQVVGVGALQPGELRRLNLSVQMLPLVVQAQPRPQASAAATASASAAAARPSLGRALGGTPAAATPAPMPTSTSPAATSGTARPATTPAPLGGTPRATPSPVTAPTAATAPSSATAPSAAKAPASTPAPQPPGAAQSQRLRIFRKP